MRTHAQRPEITSRSALTQSKKPVSLSAGQNNELHPIPHLQATIGNQAMLRFLRHPGAGDVESHLTTEPSLGFIHHFLGLQSKLAVNTPGDAYEQEADRIAEQVMHTAGEQSSGHPRIREVNAKHFSANHQNQETSVRRDLLLQTPGQQLEPSDREFMETRFGHDFSSVRVHHDHKAAASAHRVAALAYTVGHEIVFGAGQYAPGTSRGRRLLAHELTHVLQQSRAISSLSTIPGHSGAVSTPTRVMSEPAIQRTNGGGGGASQPIPIPTLTRGTGQEMARQALQILEQHAQAGQQARAELADALFSQVARFSRRPSPYDDAWSYRRIEGTNGIIFRGPGYSVAFDAAGRMWRGGGVNSERGEYTLEGTNVTVNYNYFGQTRARRGSGGEYELVPGRGRAPGTGRTETVVAPIWPVEMVRPASPPAPGTTSPGGSAPAAGTPPAPPQVVSPAAPVTAQAPLTSTQLLARVAASIAGTIVVGLAISALRSVLEARLMEQDARALEPEINARLNALSARVAALRAQSPQQQLYANITVRLAEREYPVALDDTETAYDGMTLLSVQVSTQNLQEEARGMGHERHIPMVWYFYRMTYSLPLR